MNLMRMMYKTATLLVVVFAFVACDDEYSTVGGEIIENTSDLELEEVEVTAYSKKINSVQTNKLGNHLLGVYNHPIYGQTTASILTQISLPTQNPTFGTEPELDSVVLTIPYFSTEADSDEDGNITYALDSVYGNTPIKISIQESNYYLRDLDPDADFQDSQRYYSDDQDLFEQNLTGEVIYENDNFLPSNQAIVSYEENDQGEQDTIASGPALRIKLPTAYFQEKIIENEGSGVLSNNNNFKNYLRGMFIKAEPKEEDGTMIFFNLNKESGAGIELFYTNEVETTNDDGGTDTIRRRKQYKLDLGSTIVNSFKGEYPGDILQAIEESNAEAGAEKLFLNGGEGSMAVIELFQDEEQIEALKEKDWLINEVNLNFYVDKSFVSEMNEYNRLYLYDLDNGRLLADLSFARNFVQDFNSAQPLNSLTSFSKILKDASNDEPVGYKINLTQHVTNILEDDAENVRLGLVLVDNINNVFLDRRDGPITPLQSGVRGLDDIETIPSEVITTPEGTVLHGNLSNDEEKRLKLRIYYTEIK
ncbi:DUF4270 domain-containing protein [Salegentibacter maritimus]|uniref:DUF4270 domain-containing protein n=1 Tax=Salegentibacter maritimus TaxID=2794347 RepID=UPI0018E4D6CE|nr:DUF4270 domain-containing protein [Salegentibacter maritimus]MBI6117202.1 DUF4270 domain-containing protein [Salegentibacter maritimus]